MDTWDDDKLAKVVLSKAGNPKTSTDIVCKFFIQAIEDQKYGWFWECVRGPRFPSLRGEAPWSDANCPPSPPSPWQPNGVECKYRHALPPGYVLNSEKKKKDAEAKAKVITLEEFLESEVRRQADCDWKSEEEPLTRGLDPPVQRRLRSGTSSAKT